MNPHLVEALAFAANPPLGVDPRSEDYCYTPCDNGLHVCGHHPDGMNCLTVVNMRVRDADQARALFDAAKVMFERRADEPDDYVVDLQQDDNCIEDFCISRQMLEPLLHFWGQG